MSSLCSHNEFNQPAETTKTKSSHTGRRNSIGISLNHALEKDLNQQPSVSIFTVLSSSPIHLAVIFFSVVFLFIQFPIRKQFLRHYPHIYTLKFPPDQKKNRKPKHIITIFNNSPIRLNANEQKKNEVDSREM